MVDVGTRLVIHRARWKTAILLAPFLLLAAVFVFLPFMRDPPVKLIGILGLPLLLAAIAVLLTRLVQPDRLVLTPAGFHTEGGVRGRASRPVRWNEVTDFHLRYSRFRIRARIGWNRRGSRLTHSSLLRFLFSDGLVEGGWAMPPEGLVKVLEEWRSRYSTASS